ncbi:MAG: hypothetical protein F4038_08165 [Chloroflexi bacterium]|nr:hypothetical protein [Chloroflexota bacterium]MYG89960.1 hypothetical protein [Chloroflexota bacterium]MYJ93006.1 hypothetical protein [Chloroflexota bacterium]
MRRRLLLLGGLTCAVAIALLLRTAASDFESAMSVDLAEPVGSVVGEIPLEDCSIVPDSEPGLAAREAATIFPISPADAVDIAVSRHADERSVAFSPEADLNPPQSPSDLYRDTIRPPPPAPDVS